MTRVNPAGNHLAVKYTWRQSFLLSDLRRLGPTDVDQLVAHSRMPSRGAYIALAVLIDAGDVAFDGRQVWLR